MEMVGVVFSMNSEEVHWVHVLQRNVVGVERFFLSNLSLLHSLHKHQPIDEFTITKGQPLLHFEIGGEWFAHLLLRILSDYIVK